MAALGWLLNLGFAGSGAAVAEERAPAGAGSGRFDDRAVQLRRDDDALLEAIKQFINEVKS